MPRPCPARGGGRFLIQAAFGPDQDSAADPDMIPENVEEVMATGIEAWIDDQIARPVGLLQPWVDWVPSNRASRGSISMATGNSSLVGTGDGLAETAPRRGQQPASRPLATASRLRPQRDPRRLRPARAARVEQRGVANYYDLMVTHAFGNYEDLLYAVATHPAMGMYLSHLNNQKANPALKLYPDENFAREIMQLFSIGLWELNEDGTRKTYPSAMPRWASPSHLRQRRHHRTRPRLHRDDVWRQKLPGSNGDYTQPMKMWDAHHDCEPKTLLGGLQLPARTPSASNTGTAGLADVAAAVENLFNHPNVGPFLARQLIQRLITSNPSPEYVGRVAAKFANNGANVRGDLGAVVKAILLDPRRARRLPRESRVGKNARAFPPRRQSRPGLQRRFAIGSLRPRPVHPRSPPGSDERAERLQLLLARPFAAGRTDPARLRRARVPDPQREHRDHRTELLPQRALAETTCTATAPPPNTRAAESRCRTRHDRARRPDRRRCPDRTRDRSRSAPAPLDLVLTGSTLEPEQFQIIREAMLAFLRELEMAQKRLNLAIYLIVTSAEYNVLR